MAKKGKLPVQRDEELSWIDSELEAAMAQLDGVNEKVGELLQPYERAGDPGTGEPAQTEGVGLEDPPRTESGEPAPKTSPACNL